MFFESRGEVHQTMRRLVRNLKKAKIPYVIVGGMAVNAHRYERMTKDVDVLLTQEGFAEFKRLFVPKDYEQVAGLRRFLDRKNQRTVDILLTGHFPGSGQPGPIAYPDPANVSETVNKIQVLNLATLIQLKLAARRHQDFGDVVNLIRLHDLDEGYLDHLHPSVRQDFIECLEEKRREDQYLARQNDEE
jgi:hypothetical protein